MLTGMMEITSGTAYINNLDCRTDIITIRQKLGLCPQHDILFDNLTGLEHLYLYSSLHGLTKAQATHEINGLINSINFNTHVHKLTKNMSGGQKRKLSTILALLGDSKVIFLDEMTSGMDPYARRETWATLKQYRTNRTIVFTTHFMDEADILGDRIAIMSTGQIICCGTSLFLKSLYGVGYTLVITCKKDLKDSKQIIKTIKKHIKSATLLSNAASEISFRLSLQSTSLFPKLLKDIDQKKSNLIF